MQEFIKLPKDTSGYGDFGVLYVGVDAFIHFSYNSNGSKFIGEIKFTTCISFLVNGVLNRQKKIEYDAVHFENYINENYEGYKKYTIMLSGSDFQFEIVAEDCEFNPSIEFSTLIESL